LKKELAMRFFGTWVRWILLSSLLFAAIGFAEGGEDEPQTPSDNLPADYGNPNAGLPYYLPRRIPLSTTDAIASFDPKVLSSLTEDERKRLGEEIARLAKGLYTYAPGTLMQPPASVFGDSAAKVEVHASEVDPKEELAISRAQYAQENGSAHWTADLWHEFGSSGTITIPSRYEGLSHVFKVKVIFGVVSLQKGLENIAIDFSKDIQSGIHEIVVTLPESIWAKNQFSVRQTAMDVFGSLTGIAKQITGSKQSVPAFTSNQTAWLVSELARHSIVTRELERVAQSSFEGESHQQNVFQQALLSADLGWETKGQPEAAKEVQAELESIRSARGLDPKTEASLLALGLEVRQRAFVTNAILEHQELGNFARQNGVDMRLNDYPLMEKVSERVSQLEAAHSKQWETVQATITSAVYSELLPQYSQDPVALAQATVDEVQKRKQESFYGLLEKDSGLDTCHPRAAGIGKLLVEHGRALQLIYENEQQFAQSLVAQKSSFEAQVNSAHPIRSFSSKFRTEKVEALLTETYQATRDKRYRDLVAKLNDAGYANSAALLAATLDEFQTVDRTRMQVQQATVPSRTFTWSMDALEPTEWTIRKVDETGKFVGDAKFDQWVTSNQSFYKLRAWWRNTQQAYRALRQHVWRGQFYNGPFGLKAWLNAEPFAYKHIVNPETGEVVIDDKTVRPTWLSNMGAVAEWGNRTWNAERWRAIPGFVWRPAAATVATVGTVGGMAGWTAVRVAGTALVGGTAVVAGSPLGAAAWAPLWATMASGFSHLVYDIHRAEATTTTKRADAWTRFKWLSWGGLAAGVAFAGYDGYLDWIDWKAALDTNAGMLIPTLDASATALSGEVNTQIDTSVPWMQFLRGGLWDASKGLFAGMGIGTLGLLEARGFGALIGKTTAQMTYSLERLTAALSVVPLRVMNVGKHLVAKALLVRGLEYGRDFAFREVFLNLLLDKVFGLVGGDGVTVNDSFFLQQVQGPGVASQHFLVMRREQALVSLWTTFEKIDLENWEQRRAEESLEPRANFLSHAGISQLAAVGETDVENSPLGQQILRAEAADTKFRKQFVSDRLKALEPVTKVLSTFQGRIRFSEGELATLRLEGAQLAQRFFERMAHPDTTETQRQALWSAHGVKPGDWQALTDKLLESTFGVGVLQSLQSADRASYADIQSKGITGLLDQVLAGENLDTSDQVTIHAVPEAVRSANATTPFLGSEHLCSTQLRVQATRLPWEHAAK
jgi:hypothetical protein